MIRQKCRRRVIVMGVSLLTACHGEIRQQGPGLGRPASEAMVKNWNIDVFPDGVGLPEGRGSAMEGNVVYQRHCQQCHGVEGSGDSADELAGALHGLTDEPPDKTIGTYWPYATTLFDFTRRAMPLTAPGSLTNDQLYAVTAYLLYLNGIIQEREVMNAATLANVKMPNRHGFINHYQQEK
ncbi:cytochrome c [Methylomarinum sp. Ch1-1]|uniref:Cytochrome c n=1 Tax=Methylomarinum roseum TaxID=3067653 RepID=A0AAU7NSW6_9GAMM|nr:cytochrome c [Methylomarinum sp. Ch1-1]MDP4519935.1 cytochrome c [Methylomarinum sp. Ch1-1]